MNKRGGVLMGGVICSILSLLLLWLTGGEPGLAMAPMVLWILVLVAPLIPGFSDTTLALGFVFASYFLDEPSANPWYEVEPFTETIGRFLYSAPKRTIGLPLPISFFEIFSYLLAFWFLYKRSLQLRWNPFHNPSLRNIILLSSSLFLTSLIGVVYGQMNGAVLDMARLQVKLFPVLAAWTVIGYVIYDSPDVLEKFYKILFVCMIWKGLMGLFVYFVLWGGSRGEHRYLMDHNTSFFMGTCFLYGGTYFLFDKSKSRGWKAMVLVGIAIMFIPFVINNRRTELVGIAMTLIFMPFFLGIKKFLRFWKWAVGAGVLGGLFLMATWNAQGVLGWFSNTIKNFVDPKERYADASNAYRVIENFDQMMGLAENPVFGLGWGNRFREVIKLPSIDSIYDLYNAIPHNQVLYVWCFGGAFCLAALSATVAVAIGTTGRLMQGFPKFPSTLAAFIAYGILLRWLLFIWADMSLTEPRMMLIMGSVLGAAWRGAEMVGFVTIPRSNLTQVLVVEPPKGST